MIITPFNAEELELDTCDNDPEQGKRHGRATYKIKYDNSIADSTYLCMNCLKELQKVLAEILT